MNYLNPIKVKELEVDSVYAPAGSAVKNDEHIIYNPHQALAAYIIHYDNHNISGIHLPKLINTFTFSKTNVLPKRHYDQDNPLDFHFMIAESKFSRMLALSGSSKQIDSIDVISNPILASKFENKKKEFNRRNVDDRPIFCFHGTPQQNVDEILKLNFDLKKVKRTAHGFGIYFSEQPDVSIGYAGGSHSLILCQVLLGEPGKDSKEVGSGQEGCWAVIIGGDRAEGRMDQILPTYVVNFK